MNEPNLYAVQWQDLRNRNHLVIGLLQGTLGSSTSWCGGTRIGIAVLNDELADNSLYDFRTKH